jgi:N-acyl-D-amino-acid deacylase
MHEQPPAEVNQIIRYMLGRPLDFDPGDHHCYSNFGYCLLGRVIEKISGESYVGYVQKHVLGPLSITDMRMGKSLLKDRASGEVRYYAGAGKLEPAVIGDNVGSLVPEAYGGFYLEPLDAHGGWIASAPVLVTFACAFDNPARSPLLKSESIRQMFARPTGAAGYLPTGASRDPYYACGWQVRQVGQDGKFNSWHSGLLTGSSATLLVRRHDGVSWAVLFNTDADANGKYLVGQIDPLIHKAADAVKQWP